MIRLEIDGKQITALINELGLTERQAKAAMSRAVRRAAATLRRRAEKSLKSELDIRKMNYLRARLKSLRLQRTGFEGLRMWFGENDMPMSALRGRVTKTADGARFAGKAGTRDVEGGFISKAKFGRTIFKRVGAKRLPIEEQRVPVKEQMDALIEGELFAGVLELIWKNFERDMLARARHGVGVGA